MQHWGKEREIEDSQVEQRNRTDEAVDKTHGEGMADNVSPPWTPPLLSVHIVNDYLPPLTDNKEVHRCFGNYTNGPAANQPTEGSAVV